MADVSGIAEKGGELLTKLVSGSVIVILILILIGFILGLALYIRYLRQFNIRVEIQSLRGSGTHGQPIYKIVRDMGGFIRRKKDQTNWFRLRGEKVDLPSPPLEALQLDAKGNNQIKIFQKSDTEYYYLLPDKIDMTTIVRGGKEIPIAQASAKISDGDVVYWGQLRKRDNRTLFDTETLIMKLLPYIVPMLMFMLVIFMTYLITDHWGDFASAADALQAAAEALRDATLASTTGG